MAKKTHGTTASGVPLTDEQVAELAKQAEAGYDVDETLRRRVERPPTGPAPASVESVRLEPELRQAVAQRAEQGDESTSSLIRGPAPLSRGRVGRRALIQMRTIVITPGPRRSAVPRANSLLAEAVPRNCRYRLADDWYSDQPKVSGQPEIDAWFTAEAKRRERFERKHPLQDATAFERDLRELKWDVGESAQRDRLRQLEREALISLAQLTSTLEVPLPLRMLPGALVTPEGRWRSRPIAWHEDDRRWPRWVNSTIDRYRGGHCLVEADCSC